MKYVDGLYGVYSMKVLDLAVFPTSPIRPVVGVNLALAAMLGVILGLSAAFVYDYLSGLSASH